MILGMSLGTFTQLHVLISLVGIAAGVAVLAEMIKGEQSKALALVFLVTTIATSATGFLFPAGFGPAHVIGIISLADLVVAVVSLYMLHLQGNWRWMYAVSATIALYLNVFVAVVQTFQK